MFSDIAKIKKILLEQSYISQEDHTAAEAAERKGEPYIDYLIHSGLLSYALLGQAIAESYHLPFADLSVNAPVKEQVQLLPEDVARAAHAIVAAVTDGDVLIATDTPETLKVEQLKQYFPKKKVHIAYTLPAYISDNMRLYDQPLETRFSKIITSGQRIAPELVDEIIKEAVSYRASDIHFEPQLNEVIIRFRVDGILHEAGRLQSEQYDNILNRIKVESGMRIDEHMSTQDGAMRRQDETATTDLRVSLVPTVRGEKVVMRVLSSYVQGFTLTDLGFQKERQEEIEEYARKPFGMILTVGPTGSGKTTTLYAFLKLLNDPRINITTIEDPVEYKMPGVNQIQVREQSNMTFAKGLRSIVRQDPDVILVGEIRDRETAEIAVNAALTGHLLLSTFHANDAATSIPRLIDMGIEPFLLASTLEVVIAQRLARKICDRCRYSVSITEVLQKLHNGKQLARYFAKSDTVYAGKGCNVCSGTGYRGRIAVFEIIAVTPELQDLIATSPSAADIWRLAQKQGTRSMFEDGITKVKSGATTLAELLRVVELPRHEA
ncbi:MAG TPA: ATPase, T2SS/T4P/T4SS family [Candidatus Saccharimonadales bacterium]